MALIVDTIKAQIKTYLQAVTGVEDDNVFTELLEAQDYESFQRKFVRDDESATEVWEIRWISAEPVTADSSRGRASICEVRWWHKFRVRLFYATANPATQVSTVEALISSVLFYFQNKRSMGSVTGTRQPLKLLNIEEGVLHDVSGTWATFEIIVEDLQSGLTWE